MEQMPFHSCFWLSGQYCGGSKYGLSFKVEGVIGSRVQGLVHYDTLVLSETIILELSGTMGH